MGRDSLLVLGLLGLSLLFLLRRRRDTTNSRTLVLAGRRIHLFKTSRLSRRERAMLKTLNG